MERSFFKIRDDITIIASRKIKTVEIWPINGAVLSTEDIDLALSTIFDIERVIKKQEGGEKMQIERSADTYAQSAETVADGRAVSATAPEVMPQAKRIEYGAEFLSGIKAQNQKKADSVVDANSKAWRENYLGI